MRELCSLKMWLCRETQMISTANIWLAQDALVYFSLDMGQCHCPLGLSLVHIHCSRTAQGRATCYQRLQLCFFPSKISIKTKSVGSSYFHQRLVIDRGGNFNPLAEIPLHCYHKSKMTYLSHMIKTNQASTIN